MIKRFTGLILSIAVMAMGCVALAQDTGTGGALDALKGYRYLPYAVSRAAEKAAVAADANKNLVEAFKEWSKAHDQGSREMAETLTALRAATAKADSVEVGRLTALKAAKEEELLLADEVLKMEVGGVVGDERVDGFIGSVSSEVGLITSELMPDERLDTLKLDAFSQMNAAVQAMNSRAMGKGDIPSDKVDAMKRGLADLYARYTEIIGLLGQLQK